MISKIVKYILIILLFAMLFFNLINIKEYLTFTNILFVLIISILLIFINKNNNDRLLKIIGIILLAIGIIIRIYLFFSLKITLKSDFELYFNTALDIYNRVDIRNVNYLLYNNYVCIYSSVLALIFKIFGSKLSVVLIYNFICQIGTVTFLYKIISLFNNKLKYFLPSIWFVLPTVISANFLVSTETLYIFLLSFIIWFYNRIKDSVIINKQNIVKYILLGIVCSIANNIRPIMFIFIICLLLEWFIIYKKKNRFILLFLTAIFFLLCNMGFQKYSENLLGGSLKKGAFEWSLLYGSNYKYRGVWNLEDNEIMGKCLEKKNGHELLLKETIKRYKDMGVLKTSRLYISKYKNLWTDVNGNYPFLKSQLKNEIPSFIDTTFKIVGYYVTIMLLIYAIYYGYKKQNNNSLVIELFMILYIFSNLLVVLNGRYNYPFYLLVIIFIGINGGNDSMKEKISKLINVYKKYGFVGFMKKLRAYIIANYLDKVSFKVILNKKKYRNIIKDILKNNKYERIILWRSSFGYNVELFQRPQHIANNLAKNKCLVFYEVTTMTDKVKIIKKQSDNLYLINFNNIALNKLLMKELNSINKPKYVQLYSTDWKLSVQNIENYINNGFGFIYEYIDHLSADLAGTKDLPKNIIEKYEYVMSHDNVYVVVTADLLEKDVIKRRGNKNLVFSSNGVDYSFFKTFDKNYKFEKEFSDVLDKKKPIIMYYGALAKWFDYELVKKVANTNKYSIVLFGIKYDEAYEESGLDNIDNVYFLGARDYKVLKNYAKCADVLTIPFKINDITKSTSPVKVFEYMALHKPIVTTDLLECRKYKSVLIGKNHNEFLKQLDIALSKKNDKKYIELLDKEAKENEWSMKAKVIVDMIKKDE